MVSLGNWMMGAKRGQNTPPWACKWLAWFLGTWTPFRLASGFACGKRFSLKQRLIPDPLERKWAVAASFHNRFNELLCPGGGESWERVKWQQLTWTTVVQYNTAPPENNGGLGWRRLGIQVEGVLLIYLLCCSPRGTMGTLLAYLLLKQENLWQHKRSKLLF